MSDNLTVDIYYEKYDENKFYSRMLIYITLLNKLSMEELISEYCSKIALETDEKKREFFRQRLTCIFKAYIDEELVKTYYNQVSYTYTISEKNISNELVKAVGEILEKESDFEIRIENTLKEAQKKHPIAAKIIALILSTIVASLIDGGVQGFLSKYIDNAVIMHEDKNLMNNCECIVNMNTETEDELGITNAEQ